MGIGRRLTNPPASPQVVACPVQLKTRAKERRRDANLGPLPIHPLPLSVRKGKERERLAAKGKAKQRRTWSTAAR